MQDGITRSAPAFVSPDSTNEDSKILLLDEFIIHLKQGFSKSDLELLNKKYNVEFSTGDIFQVNSYILSTKNNPNSNALEMANIYSDEEIIEWSAPNFLHVNLNSSLY